MNALSWQQEREFISCCNFIAAGVARFWKILPEHFLLSGDLTSQQALDFQSN